MIKVCYSEMDTAGGVGCRLEAAGHAGYAPAGQDIVCAGASCLMQGLIYLLAGEENAHSEAWDEPEGPRVAVCVDAPCEEWVRGALELAVSYDGGVWEKLAEQTVTGARRSWDIPFVPRRCSTLRLRLRGSGQITLRALIKTIAAAKGGIVEQEE